MPSSFKVQLPIDTSLVDGLGNDTWVTGGGIRLSITVVSNDLRGHSGVISHTVTSLDAAYNGIGIEGISSSVVDNDEAALAMVVPFDYLRVFELGTTTMTYTLALNRRPDEEVRVTIAPAPLKEDEIAAGKSGVSANTQAQTARTLLFTRIIGLSRKK